MFAFSMSKGYTLYGQRAGASPTRRRQQLRHCQTCRSGRPGPDGQSLLTRPDSPAGETSWCRLVNVDGRPGHVRRAMTFDGDPREISPEARLDAERLAFLLHRRYRRGPAHRRSTELRPAARSYQGGFFISSPDGRSTTLCQALPRGPHLCRTFG